MQARKTTHGLDGRHQHMDRTARGRVNQNDRDTWRKYVHGVADPRIEDGYRTEQSSCPLSSADDADGIVQSQFHEETRGKVLS